MNRMTRTDDSYNIIKKTVRVSATGPKIMSKIDTRENYV